MTIHFRMKQWHFLQFVLLLLFTQTLCAQWQPLPGPTGGNVTCWASTPDGVLYAGGTAGVFSSTDDGKTWHLLSATGAILGQQPIQLDWDNGNLYLVGQNYNSNSRVLWKSSDNGASWTNIRETIYEMIATMSVFDARNDTVVVNSASDGGTSLDGGVTWSSSPTSGTWNIIGTQHGWFSTFYSTAYRWTGSFAWLVTYMASDITMHPRRILEAGDFVFIFFSGSVPEFKYKKIGDSTWSDGILPIAYNENEISVAERNDTIFLHGGTSIAFSTDGLQTWQILPATNLTSPVKACFFTPTGAIVACTGSGIFRADSPGAAFSSTQGFTSLNTLTTLPESNGNWWSGATNGLYFSPDNGQSWQKMYTQLPHANDEIKWIKRFGNSIAAGNSTRLFYSPNHGDNWIERDLPTTAPNDVIHDVSLMGQRLFFGDPSGTWFSDDWGANWHSFSPAVSGSSIFARIFSETDSLLAVAAQWSEVYLSRDTGVTWQNFSAGLDGLPYISLEMAIGPEHLYIVSGYRLMQSPQDAPAWQQVALPLPITDLTGPYPRVFHFSGGSILAGIPGAGIYQSDDDALSWSSYAPTALYNLTNGYFFSDSLSVLSTKGGVWYKGTIGSELVGGRVFADANQNAAFDSSETPFSGLLVELKNQQIYVATDAQGRYAFDWRGQPDSLRLKLLSAIPGEPPPTLFAAAPGLDYDFPIDYDGAFTDLALDVTTSGPPRPGFSFNVYLTCRNNGYVPADANLTFVKDGAASWNGFSELPDLLVSDTAHWFVPNIPPGGSVSIQVTLKLDANTALGTLLGFSGKIMPEGVLDLRNDNNVQVFLLQVVGSLDPNDKSVSPGGNITPAMVADTQQLVYTVRFQNTGTYPAEFVRITDVLSPALDRGTLQVIASSHPMEWSLNGHTLEFYFPNIQLPDSTSDEPNSHGFVKYSIAMRPDLVLGDAVKNVADIFFDFNAPVRTNTVETKVENIIIGTRNPSASELICWVSPNPVGEELIVYGKNISAAILQVMDMQGRVLISRESGIPARIGVQDLEAGVYRVVLMSEGRYGQTIFVKVK